MAKDRFVSFNKNNTCTKARKERPKCPTKISLTLLGASSLS